MNYSIHFNRILIDNRMRIEPYLLNLDNNSLIKFKQNKFELFKEFCKNKPILYVKINQNNYLVDPQLFIIEFERCRNIHNNNIYFDDIFVDCSIRSDFYKACKWCLTHAQPHEIKFNIIA